MKKLSILFLLLFLFTDCCFSEDGIVWKKVDENNYINPDGIVKTQDNTGFIFMLKSFNKGQYESVNGRSINYTLGQYTIDCTNQTYKIGVIDSYDYDNKFVNGDYNRYAKFRPIVSGTAVGEVLKYLCKP
ncbi:MAG: hypothetical protein K2F57_06970 [Candidatus Gastranaerophilales bacterium]|nr:hypothetical protein [Candidatus Gastranaerophilales bacterium]